MSDVVVGIDDTFLKLLEAITALITSSGLKSCLIGVRFELASHCKSSRLGRLLCYLPVVIPFGTVGVRVDEIGAFIKPL